MVPIDQFSSAAQTLTALDAGETSAAGLTELPLESAWHSFEAPPGY